MDVPYLFNQSSILFRHLCYVYSFAIVNNSVTKILMHELPLGLFSLGEIPRSEMTGLWVRNILKALYAYFEKLLSRETLSLSSHQQPRGDMAPRASFLTMPAFSGVPFWACHWTVDLRTHTFIGRSQRNSGRWRASPQTTPWAGSALCLSLGLFSFSGCNHKGLGIHGTYFSFSF